MCDIQHISHQRSFQPRHWGKVCVRSCVSNVHQFSTCSTQFTDLLRVLARSSRKHQRLKSRTRRKRLLAVPRNASSTTAGKCPRICLAILDVDRSCTDSSMSLRLSPEWNGECEYLVPRSFPSTLPSIVTMKHEKSSIVHTETIVLTTIYHVFRSYLIYHVFIQNILCQCLIWPIIHLGTWIRKSNLSMLWWSAIMLLSWLHNWIIMFSTGSLLLHWSDVILGPVPVSRGFQ